MAEKKSKNANQTSSQTQVIRILIECLSNTYLLMTRTQGVHWNVTGPLFYSIHKLTEDQYGELFAATDELAERLRALGASAPADYSAMMEAATLKPKAGSTTGKAMVGDLVKGHHAIAEALRAAIETVEEASDAATADLLTERVAAHEKAAWMLDAHLVSN
jgi:starvation-inducible DNA-binding protein